VDAITQNIEDVSERFALSLHLTLTLAFDDVPPSKAELVLVNGKSMPEYLASVDYRRIVRVLLRFKCCHPEDLTSLFVLTLVYLRRMKSGSALPLLEQMIVWFDVSNVVYCIAFLAHVWLFDKAVRLQDWHDIAEGVVQGVNLNKCVRNCLRILRYLLFPTEKSVRCATLALEYKEKPRVTVDATGFGPDAEVVGFPRRSLLSDTATVEEPRRLRSTARSQPSGARPPFAPARRVRRP
jgi:hypothetical protein